MYLADLLGGIDHLEVATIKDVKWAQSDAIAVKIRGDEWATFDNDRLLRLVYLSYKYDLRAACVPLRGKHDQLGWWQITFMHYHMPHLDAHLKQLEKEYK